MPDELAGGRLLLDYPAEAVARLTLNRPESRNALDHDTLNAVAETMPSLDRGIELRCVVLTGAGGIFSAGYDIGGFSEDAFETEAESLVAHPFAKGLGAVAAHPWPVLCAINGHALGGALELTLTCDLRICARSAKLGMPPAKLGLIYGHTGLQRFIDAVGVPRTKELFLTGDSFSATRADEIGLVNRVVDDDQLEASSIELAAEIAANAPLSMKGNKHAIDTINSFARLTPEQERELIELRESCFASEDFREGVAAFAEKSKPVWKGR
ncbi:MAG: enoyl-CoA hydratase/isomerase family protein [Solirubrobacterales bacterium]